MIYRLLDSVIASVLVILLSPVIIAVSLLIWTLDGRPILYRQQRIGKECNAFILIKFRTMNMSNNTTANQSVTKLGAILRRYSLDELPQLINVLSGSLSLVGPRPLLEEYLPYYTKKEMSRHSVLPGITGLAQVSGRNSISWDEKLELDVKYVQNRSVLLYIKILLLSVKVVLMPSGINFSDSITMEKFSDYRKRSQKTKVEAS